ncbi:hypothetical protein B0O80DRAFT_451909, partial [Mortierella sp. GBAus27b]
MDIPWILLAQKVVLATFGFLMLKAVSVGLWFYSWRGDHHSNSIRWAQKGGYLEMTMSLWDSRKTIPGSVKFAMVVTILATVVASFADNGAAYFIHITTKHYPHEPIVASTFQFMPLKTMRSFKGWTSSIRHGENITDAMTRMITNPKNIPNSINGRTYTPRRSEYEIDCNHLDFRLFAREDVYTVQRGGCGLVEVYFTFIKVREDFISQTAIKNNGNRWSVVSPSNATSLELVRELSSGASFTYNNWNYAADRSSEQTVVPSKDVLDGLIDLPYTFVTILPFPSEEVVVLSQSSSSFAAPSVQQFKSMATSIYDEYDELLQAMEQSINTPTGSLTPAYYVEMRVVNTTIDAIACANDKRNQTIIICSYIHINIAKTKKQPVDPLMKASIEGRPSQSNSGFSRIMDITHVPTVIDGKQSLISVSVLRNGTAEATHYMTSLGNGFIPDWNTGRLYILFDVTSPEFALDIPLWLIVVMSTLSIICIVLWITGIVLVDKQYRNSLYEDISNHVAAKAGVDSPMLMRSKADPLEFECVPITAKVPSNDSTASPTEESQHSH